MVAATNSDLKRLVAEGGFRRGDAQIHVLVRQRAHVRLHHLGIEPQLEQRYEYKNAVNGYLALLEKAGSLPRSIVLAPPPA